MKWHDRFQLTAVFALVFVGTVHGQDSLRFLGDEVPVKDVVAQPSSVDESKVETDDGGFSPLRRLSSSANTNSRDYGRTQTGLSGTPSSYSSGSLSIDHSSFGGKHYSTLAPFGVAGGEYLVYIVGALITAIYAWFYKLYVVNQIPQFLGPQKGPCEETDDFDFGICSCWYHTCMCAQLICPCCVYIRQAHTNEVTKICGFWPTFWSYTITGLCCCIGPFCLTVWFRMKLKDHLMIEDHCLNDLCLAWFCMPCAVGQTALHVDQALEYDVEICCDLKWHRDDGVQSYDMPGAGQYFDRNS